MREGARYITDLDYREAREHLLKGSSYFDMELPKYFNFEPLLDYASREAERFTPSAISKWKPHQHEDLNYVLMSV